MTETIRTRWRRGLVVVAWILLGGIALHGGMGFWVPAIAMEGACCHNPGEGGEKCGPAGPTLALSAAPAAELGAGGTDGPVPGLFAEPPERPPRALPG